MPLRKSQAKPSPPRKPSAKDPVGESLEPVEKDLHPDVGLHYEWTSERGLLITLRLDTLETPQFPGGLEFGYTFTGDKAEKEAHAKAIAVQKYLDGLKYAWRAENLP